MNRTAYAILIIDKATKKVVRAQFASEFPVTGLFSEAQLLLAKCEGVNYHDANTMLKRCVMTAHAWATPLFAPMDGLRVIDSQEDHCARQGHTLTAELHVCPMRANLRGDERPHCKCCSRCAHACEQNV
jgi:hypothetical protein